MHVRIVVSACFLILFGAAVAQAQQIQVSRENRTIAVSATDTVEASPDVAVVSIGYHNYGKTHDEAYDDNVRAADQIVNALLAAGVPKENIQTETINLNAIQYAPGNWTPEEKQERQFEATQTWNLRLSASIAQKCIDLAVQAGANQLQNVDWQVADPKALEAKADAAALTKARSLAESMAAHLRIQLGELIFASNRPEITKNAPMLAALAKFQAAPAPPPNLKLFPKKVSQSATVYAVFVIQ